MAAVIEYITPYLIVAAAVMAWNCWLIQGLLRDGIPLEPGFKEHTPLVRSLAATAFCFVAGLFWPLSLPWTLLIEP